MQKKYSRVLHFFIFLCLSLIISFKSYSTNVTGGIYSSTTWTKANSPYIITDTVVIFEGVTVNIEPGVIVEFNKAGLIEQRGSLYANGTTSDSIIFTSSSTTPYAGIYNGIQLSAATDSFSYARFSYATTAIDVEGNGAFPLNNCSFMSNLCGINRLSETRLINNCLFKYDSVGIQQSGSFETLITGCEFRHCGAGIFMLQSPLANCIFSNNDYGIKDGIGERAYISNCTFDSNKVCAISVVADSITLCSIRYNGIGIQSSNNIIVLNDISDNIIGIESPGDKNISCNSICNNTLYNLETEVTTNINVSGNYWCSTDSASIQATIYDGHQNLNLGLVIFTPFETTACAGVTTGIKQVTAANTASPVIFPNPSSGPFTIKFTGNQLPYNVVVYNVVGQQVYYSTLNDMQSEIDLSAQPTGIYFVQIKSSGDIKVEKVTIAK